MPETPPVDLSTCKNDTVEESAPVAPEEPVRQEHGIGPTVSTSHQASDAVRSPAMGPPAAVDEMMPNTAAKDSAETIKPKATEPQKDSDVSDQRLPVPEGNEKKAQDHDVNPDGVVRSPDTAPQRAVVLPRPTTPINAIDETQVPPPLKPSTPSYSLGLLSNPISPQASRPPTSDPTTTRPVSTPEFASGHLDAHQLLEDAAKSSEQSRSGHTALAQPTQSSMTGTSPLHSPHRPAAIISPTAQVPLSHTPIETPTPSPGLQSPNVRSPPVHRRGPQSDDGRPTSSVLKHDGTRETEETSKLHKHYDRETGRKHLNKYVLEGKLGSGQHGTVKRGRHIETNERVAVKIVRRFSKRVRLGKTGDPNDAIKKEVAILKKARHPHVVGLYEVIDDPEYDKVYLVLEYVERGEIVWRKSAEKDIAMFEKERTEREVLNGHDEEATRRYVDAFNTGVKQKRAEIRKLLEGQEQKENSVNAFTSESIEQHDSLLAHSHRNDTRGEVEVSNQDLLDQPRLSRADVQDMENPTRPLENVPSTFTAIPMGVHRSMLSPHQSQPNSGANSAYSSTRNSRRNSVFLSHDVISQDLGDSMSEINMDIERDWHQLLEPQQEEWSPEDEYYRFVPCLSLSQASDAFRDTVLGIEYLHYQGIIHRDIKPANLLWTKTHRVKISDFGVSYLGKPMRGESELDDLPADHDETLELAKTVGTPAFYAPELCDPDIFDPEKKASRPAITGQIDVWALGVTLFCMVFGRLPFFDQNEFRMYEKIAHEELFIPKVRLKGVSHTEQDEMDFSDRLGKKERLESIMMSNDETERAIATDYEKRGEEYIAYEPVEDTLVDLLKRLLVKDPAKRITLTEVKHHPWVIGHMENREQWLAQTDPSHQAEGKKIEVSTEEVQEAVVGVTIFERILGNVSKMIRGSSQRKGHNSTAKTHERASSTASQFNEGRRGSLREDQQILAALKHPKESTHRESPEHPLSHSVAASPGGQAARDYFGVDEPQRRPHTASEGSIAGESASTSESTRTIRGKSSFHRRSVVDTQQSNSAEDLTSTTHSLDQGSSSSLGGMLTGAGRRIATAFRSRERGAGGSPSHTSRSSSIDTTARDDSREDYRATPSLGYSSATATGLVDPPPALQEEDDQLQLPVESSAESLPHYQHSRVQQQRRQIEAARRAAHRRSISYATGTQIPPIEDGSSYNPPRPLSAAESNFAISSSSDQIVSCESAVHSRIPSVVSRASSVSATPDNPKRFLPNTWVTQITAPHTAAELEQTIGADPAIAKARAQQEEEAGYNGEAEGAESDSDDEGLAMA